MAESNWTEMVNSLNSSNVKRGVTAGAPSVPNGGGASVFGMASQTNSAGTVALYTNLADFSPTAKGGEVTGAVMRHGGGGGDAHSAGFYFCAQGNDVNDLAYIVGLSDEDPARLQIRKGTLISGMPDGAAGTNGVLARSVDTFDLDEWVHLRFEVVVNTSGDVVLNVYTSDLAVNPVTAPSWDPVEGMRDTPGGVAATAYIDDTLAVNSGSSPLVAGRVGFFGHFADIARAVYFDHVTVSRQV